MTELSKITALASGHAAAQFSYGAQGRAPDGYIQGMALVYGRVYCNLVSKERAALVMAAPATHDSAHDALAYYRGEFDKLGIAIDTGGVATLRALFVLLVGLGMAESSGKWYCGRDRSANNVTAGTCEAGLFQTSYNAVIANPELPALFAHYRVVPDSGFLDVFRLGAGHTNPADLENYGSGDGAAFQKLSKECPAFAAEFAAIVLRHLRGHYGTIDRYVVQINPALVDLFQDVERLIGADYVTFAAALSDTPLSSPKEPSMATPTPATSTPAPPVPQPIAIPQGVLDEAAAQIEALLVAAVNNRNPVLGAILKAVLDAGRAAAAPLAVQPPTGPAPQGAALPLASSALEAAVSRTLIALATQFLASLTTPK